ncbi:MAG: hypothetical protein SF052_00415 [Bacteroidia bacterium]|nr:hypothetical protein [Bacteroidia bacterium]
MKNKLIILTVILAIIALNACKSTKTTTSSSEGFHAKGMRIVQGNSVFHLDEEYNAVPLKKGAFSIQFLNAEYNTSKGLYGITQVAAFSQPKDMSELQSGVRTSQISYFQPGTGLAGPYEGGYLYVDEKNAHHYLYYSLDESSRCDLLSEGTGGLLELSWTVNQFDFDGKRIPVKKWTSDNVYLVIFIDRNANQLVEKGEFARVAIRFQ